MRAKPESINKAVGGARIDQSWDFLYVFGFLVDKKSRTEAALGKDLLNPQFNI